MTEEYLELTAEVVAAYVSNNSIRVSDFPALIVSVHAALKNLNTPDQPQVGDPNAKLTPAQIRKSITHKVLLSFEDGKPYKTLKRHLQTRGLTPDAYREKWGLPSDYPMVAASYSERRSTLALTIGLGSRGRSAKTKTAPKGGTGVSGG